jgi:hypothetical protein
MGFSLISGAEILFHCFFGICSAIFPSEKQVKMPKKLISVVVVGATKQ